MNGWNECPRCWGSGLVGGFSAPCKLPPPVVTMWDVQFRDFETHPLTLDEVHTMLDEMHNDLLATTDSPTLEGAQHAAARVIIRAMVRSMRLVPRA